MSSKTDSRNSKCDLSRRDFLGGCAACAAGFSALSALGASTAPAAVPADLLQPVNRQKTKVRLVFAHPSSEKPCWPNIGYDFEAHKKQVLEKLRASCPNTEFLVVTAQKDDHAKEILKSDSQVDGYLLYMAGCLWGNVPETIAASGKPMVIADNLYAGSGKFLTGYAKTRREGFKVIAVSSSNFQDLIDAVKCLECVKKLRSSAILVVGRKPDTEIEQQYGTKVVPVTFEQFGEAHSKVNVIEACKWADRWMRQAQKVVEPSRQDIEKSGTIYLTMLELMREHNAQAITINCLGGFYGGHMPGYPCLGFMQLDNDGLVGACEGDQRSTMTKLLMTYLVGRPGFISDPVIDTAKNQIIYAHCVAPTKVFGPDGRANPYHIRSHSEDRKGASVRSLMPLGEMTTTIEFDHKKKQVIFHQGKTVENVDEDKACRTKLAVEVKGDIYKLLNYWDQWGWHRVTFYGDLKRPVYNVAALLGFEVVEEA
ncbi:MAG TPA: hypothetical protein VMW16_05480 [Sedimentisphaerales bacterium]|nr:hypothetical protein [Sedimentisphaerales bacterium]